MGNSLPVAQEFAARRMAEGLSALVGTGRTFDREFLARATGLSGSAIEKYCRAENTPGLASFMSILAALPPEFCNHMIGPCGLGGARRLDGGARAAALVMSDLASETAVFAKALADGRIDHIERAELKRTLATLIPGLLEFQAALGRDAG